MKKILSFLSVYVLLLAAPFCAAEVSKDLQFSSSWARSGNVALTDSTEFPGAKCLEYTGTEDFCTTYSEQIPVKTGEIYELTAEIKAFGKGNAGISVVARQGEDVKSWTYGNAGVQNAAEEMKDAKNADFQKVTARFVVPDGITSIIPRIVGSGMDASQTYRIFFRNFTLQKTGELQISENAPKYTLENASLKLVFDSGNGTFDVQDKRTSRVWKQSVQGGMYYVLNSEATKKSVKCTLLYAPTMTEFRAKITLTSGASAGTPSASSADVTVPEVRVTLSADPEMPLKTLSYPAAFESDAKDRVILPVNEGISFPVTEKKPGVSRFYTYGGHGLCMAFWAQCEEEFVPASGIPADSEASAAPNAPGEIVGRSGYLAIFDSNDDAGLEMRRVSEDAPFLTVHPYWEAQKQKFGYDRTLRYAFFERADVTAMLKYYRKDASEKGLVVPFSEKEKRNPNLKEGFNRLIGAANIWYFGGNKIKVYTELQKLGVKKILASAGGSAEEIKKMNEMPGILTSRYDIYQDSMDPARTEDLGYYSDAWTGAAWERGELMRNAAGDWIRGWEVSQKDKSKPRIPCGVLCDMCAVPYEQERVSKELKEKPFLARFIDTTTASPWRECYDPNHPCTRTQSKNAKMQLLGTLGSEFNLVTGSETGHEASVPFCDFYEGMMSLGPYRVPDSGRNIPDIWEEAPERTVKYQVGEAFRMPLWELVYHDCTVSYWYWGDYNNKLPQLWAKRDLFNALYGVPPMYIFTGDNLERFRTQIAESYTVAQPVSEMTGRSEMTSFRVISRDRSVQQTEFACGVRVTANFGDSDYRMSDGYVLGAKKTRVETRK